MKKISVRNFCQTALFAAILAVLSQICIPMPLGVPLTLQTFGVSLCANLLGWKRGSIAVWVYLALGAVGLPVFSGFGGGAAKLSGVTGGFLWGFVPLAVLCGCGNAVNMRTKRQLVGWMGCILLQLTGLLLCHGCGVVQFALVTGSGLAQSMLTVSLPYLLKDMVSLLTAFVAASALQKRLKQSHISIQA